MNSMLIRMLIQWETYHIEIVSDRGRSTNSMLKSIVEEKELPLTRSMSTPPSRPSVFKRCIEHITLDLLPHPGSRAIASFWIWSSQIEGVFRICLCGKVPSTLILF